MKKKFDKKFLIGIVIVVLVTILACVIQGVSASANTRKQTSTYSGTAKDTTNSYNYTFSGTETTYLYNDDTVVVEMRTATDYLGQTSTGTYYTPDINNSSALNSNGTFITFTSDDVSSSVQSLFSQLSYPILTYGSEPFSLSMGASGYTFGQSYSALDNTNWMTLYKVSKDAFYTLLRSYISDPTAIIGKTFFVSSSCDKTNTYCLMHLIDDNFMVQRIMFISTTIQALMLLMICVPSVKSLGNRLINRGKKKGAL